MHSYICKICGDKFKAVNKGRITCSVKCRGLLLSKEKISNECIKCGKIYSVIPARSKKTKYCSKQCQTRGIALHIFSPEHRRKIGIANTGKKRPLLSLMNKMFPRRGKDSSNWKGGITRANSVFRGRREFKEWKDTVFKRDKWTCKMCGKVGGNLNAHHIKRFSDFPTLRTEIGNGITLCYKCHNITKGHEERFENIFFNILDRHKF